MKTGKLIYIIMIISMLFLYACGGGGGGSGDENSNLPTPEAPGLTVEQTQNALYAVYGGIGYNDSQKKEDDALLYRIMVSNMNSIGIDLILKTVFGDPSYVIKLGTLLTLSSANFTSSDDSYKSTLTINRKALKDGYYEFDASLSVEFKSDGTGYTYGTACKVYGTGQDTDLTAYFTGDFNYTIKDGLTLIIRTVKITAGNGLKTVQGGATTTYDNWELAYTINYGKDDPMGGSGTPTNLGLISSYNMISGDKTYPDNRDYTLGGTFTINDKKFSFAPGFRYEQKEYTYSKNNKPVPYIMMSANGSLSVPGLDDYIGVSSLLDTSNPDTNGTIITSVFENSSWSTDWLSGNLKFTTSEGDTSVVFDKGSVRFADSWTVNNWKTALDPLK